MASFGDDVEVQLTDVFFPLAEGHMFPFKRRQRCASRLPPHGALSIVVINGVSQMPHSADGTHCKRCQRVVPSPLPGMCPQANEELSKAKAELEARQSTSGTELQELREASKKVCALMCYVYKYPP